MYLHTYQLIFRFPLSASAPSATPRISDL